MEEKIILQVLMGLDIGGAETHVVELAIELKKRGYRVIVASSGGLYESKLKENNIELVNLPLNKKDVISVKKSRKTLSEIIRKKNIRLIHCHGRIPAFVVGRLQDKLDFTMITTAHGTFKVNPLLRRLTKWGDQVFYVSQDIKEYLIENYKLDRQRMHATINGINLEKFRKRDKKAEAIVHISRLDKSTSKIAYYLLDYGKYNQKEKIIIVGHGQEFTKLKKIARAIPNINLVGRSEDVGQYLNREKIFVGISRAALEAMCYNLPIILAGNYGYMGILEEKKLAKAMYNNFTARNTKALSYRLLRDDLDHLLACGDGNYQWEREFIKRNYSVKKMTDDYEKIYNLYL